MNYLYWSVEGGDDGLTEKEKDQKNLGEMPTDEAIDFISNTEEGQRQAAQLIMQVLSEHDYISKVDDFRQVARAAKRIFDFMSSLATTTKDIIPNFKSTDIQKGASGLAIYSQVLDFLTNKIDAPSDESDEIIKPPEYAPQRPTQIALAAVLASIRTYNESLLDLLPYLQEQAKKLQKKKAYQNASIYDLLQVYAAEGDDAAAFDDLQAPVQVLQDAIGKARAKLAAIAAGTSMSRPVHNLTYPLDKINKNVWSLGEEGNFNLPLDMKSNSDRKQRDVIALYSINFDALHDVNISKQLTPFDKRVYIACFALYLAGNRVVTLTKIHDLISKSKPSPEQLQKINDSITKMSLAKIQLDTTAEAKVYKGYRQYKDDYSLLYMARRTEMIDGKIQEAAIVFVGDNPLPLMNFAEQRKQVTTITPALLQTPLKKTDQNIMIEDYLLEQITWAMNKRKKEITVLFDTLFDDKHLNIAPGGNDRLRAKKAAETALNHYIKHGYVISFTRNKDGFRIKVGTGAEPNLQS